MLKVGFYLRELNFRGIANSIFIYAKNNQTILKNKSIIFYNSTALDNKTEAIKEFKKKFKTIKISSVNKLENINTILKLKKSNLKVIYKPYTKDDARSLVQNRIGSKVKAEKEINFTYKYNLEQGLQKLIEWRIKTGLDD